MGHLEVDQIEAYLMGELPADELRQLEANLLRDGDLRRELARQAALRRNLFELYRAHHADQASPAPSVPGPDLSAALPSHIVRFLSDIVRHLPGGELIVGGLVLLAVCGALWGVAHFIQAQYPSPHSQPGPIATRLLIDPPAEHVGSLATDADTRWSSASAFAVESKICVGRRYELSSGRAELKFGAVRGW